LRAAFSVFAVIFASARTIRSGCEESPSTGVFSAQFCLPLLTVTPSADFLRHWRLHFFFLPDCLVTDL